MNLKTKFAPAYNSAVRQALIWQFVVLLLGTMMLDMGESMRYFLVVSLVFWIAVVSICVRRPDQPKKYNLYFIRFGVPILCLLLPIFCDLFHG